MLKKLLLAVALGLLLTGCGTTITNLTPKQVFRNENGFYTVDARLNSDQQSLRWDSIKPTVIVGTDAFPMHYTHLMTNRWETLVPVPQSENVIFYQIKFDYSFNAFGSAPQANSLLSPKYRMQILDK